MTTSGIGVINLPRRWKKIDALESVVATGSNDVFFMKSLLCAAAVVAGELPIYYLTPAITRSYSPLWLLGNALFRHPRYRWRGMGSDANNTTARFTYIYTHRYVCMYSCYLACSRLAYLVNMRVPHRIPSAYRGNVKRKFAFYLLIYVFLVLWRCRLWWRPVYCWHFFHRMVESRSLQLVMRATSRN